MTLAQLMEKIGMLKRECLDMLEKHGDFWTPEQAEAYQQKAKEVQALEAQANAIKESRQLDATNRVLDAASQTGDNFGTLHALAHLATHRLDVSGLNAGQAAAFRNAIVTYDQELGGYLVGADVFKEITTRKAYFGSLRRLAFGMTSKTGVKVPFPIFDEILEGRIVDEGQPAEDLSVEFDANNSDTCIFTSDILPISLVLLQDSMINVMGWGLDILSSSVSRAENRAFTVGTGPVNNRNRPWGIVTKARIGRLGQQGKIDQIQLADLTHLKGSVDVAYRMKAVWMMHDTTASIAELMVDGNNRPLWQYSIIEGRPDRLQGYGVEINNHMPELGPNAKAILFGDIKSGYVIRDVEGSTVIDVYDDSAYKKKQQVGICMWTRSGGAAFDLNAYKVYQCAAQ